MKSNKITFAISLILMALFVTTCCKEECDDPTNPECINYNPCWGRDTPLKAGIRFDERVSYDPGNSVWRESISDTVAAVTRFVATDTTADYYEWRVGTDDRSWEGKSLSLYFSCPDDFDKVIPVTLITHRLSDSTCLDKALLQDTVTRNMVMIDRRKSFLMGKYNVVSSRNLNESYDIEISHMDLWSTICSGPQLIVLHNLFNIDCKTHHYIENMTNGYLFNRGNGWIESLSEFPCLPEDQVDNVAPFYKMSIELLSRDSIFIQIPDSYTTPELRKPTFIIGKRIN